MMDLRGRIALITGGARGLGAEIARQLAAQGADIAITYLQNTSAAESLVGEITALNRNAVAIQANVADFNKAQHVVDKVREKLGNLHILVCNTGIARSSAIWNMTEADWDAVLDVTLKGSFNYIRAVAPIFRDQQYGKIVCIGSINGLRGRMGTTSYNAAKSGLIGLTKTVASELGRFNVNVNLVAPGYIETPSQVATEELIRDLVLKECAIKRLGTPSDIAPLVLFLCSDEARHLTGQVIKIDAGQYL